MASDNFIGDLLELGILAVLAYFGYLWLKGANKTLGNSPTSLGIGAPGSGNGKGNPGATAWTGSQILAGLQQMLNNSQPALDSVLNQNDSFLNSGLPNIPLIQPPSDPFAGGNLPVFDPVLTGGGGGGSSSVNISDGSLGLSPTDNSPTALIGG